MTLAERPVAPVLVLLAWMLCSGGHVAKADYLSFTRNETALRAAILTSAGYDVKTRPNTTVTVSVGLNVLSLNSLNIKDQEMSISGWLSMVWTDERLTWTPSDYDNIETIFDTEKVLWRPELVIDNSVRNMGIIHDEDLVMRVRYDGRVEWEPPRIFATSCSIDVTSFPFDEQRCSIEVVSWTYVMSEVNLTHLSSDVNMADFQENGEWTFESSEVTSLVVEDNGLSFGLLRFWLRFRRRPAFQLLSTVLPIALTSVLSVLVFVLPLESGEKISYSLTVLLSYAVLLTLVSDNMPSTSIKLSIISLYMACILMLGSVAVVLTVVNLFLHHHLPHPPPPSWLVSYARAVLVKATGSNKVAQTGVTKVKEVEEPSEKVNSDRDDITKTWNDDVTSDVKESGSDVRGAMTWQEIARLHEAFCFRISAVFIALVTVVFVLALVISGYS